MTLGRVSGLFGVKGWLKVHSYTDPRESIVEFETWVLRSGNDEQTVVLEDGRKQGRTVAVKLKTIADRDQARALIGAEIAVERDALAPCEPGEYYWTDLEGSTVVTAEGEPLGRLDYVFETGGHDVMVVDGDRQHLIPFVQDKVVREVRLEQRVIVVNWDPTF